MDKMPIQTPEKSWNLTEIVMQHSTMYFQMHFLIMNPPPTVQVLCVIKNRPNVELNFW
jgi:hypothetical protein